MRIYMEVDNVINAVHGPKAWGPESFDSIDFDGMIFVWASDAVEQLVKMCKFTDAEIVWVSGWNERMPVLARLLGMGYVGADGRVLEDIGRGSTPYEKADAILADLVENPLGKGERWVWLDSASDDVMQSDAYVREMLMSEGSVPPILEGVGLTPSLLKYLVTLSGVATGGNGRGE